MLGMTELILVLTLLGALLIAVAVGVGRVVRRMVGMSRGEIPARTELAELHTSVQVLQDQIADLEIENARLREADRFMARLHDPSDDGPRPT